VIDLKLTDPDRVYEGIYTVDKGTLKICLNRQTEGTKDRPATFSTKDHDDWRLLAFEHEKDAPADPLDGLAGFVGIMVQTVDDEVAVGGTFKGSPAEKAGIKTNDVVLKVNGAEVADLQATVNSVRKAKPGEKIELLVRRGKEEKTLTAKAGVLPFMYVARLN
jgi:C-terminal processing protease CtpA/Prc